MNKTLNTILFYIAMVLAVLFSITGVLWVWYITYFVAYPVGLLSLLIWVYLRKDGLARNKLIIKTLGIGLTISMTALLATFILANFFK